MHKSLCIIEEGKCDAIKTGSALVSPQWTGTMCKKAQTNPVYLTFSCSIFSSAVNQNPKIPEFLHLGQQPFQPSVVNTPISH